MSVATPFIMHIILFFVISKTIKTALTLSYCLLICATFVLSYYNFSKDQSTIVIVGLLLVVFLPFLWSEDLKLSQII